MSNKFNMKKINMPDANFFNFITCKVCYYL